MIYRNEMKIFIIIKISQLDLEIEANIKPWFPNLVPNSLRLWANKKGVFLSTKVQWFGLNCEIIRMACKFCVATINEINGVLVMSHCHSSKLVHMQNIVSLVTPQEVWKYIDWFNGCNGITKLWCKWLAFIYRLIETKS